METTRRLSLTLMLVAPLLAAQDPDFSLSSVTGDHLPEGRTRRPQQQDYDDQEEVLSTTDYASTTEEAREREKREATRSTEDLDVAEQVVFRPYFRHSQILADRKEAEEASRRQSLGPPTASGQVLYASNPYQYSYYYPTWLDSDDSLSRLRRAVQSKLFRLVQN